MDLEIRMTRLEESHKRLEEKQDHILGQLAWVQQYMGHMLTAPSFTPAYPAPFQSPSSFTPSSTFTPQSGMLSPPMHVHSSSLSSDPCSSSQQPSTPKRSAPPTSNESPLPLSKTTMNALPSSSINKERLSSIEDVIQKYPKLKQESKAGTLACKLAKEAIFGADVMKQCTPIGNRELPGLPEKELKMLKKAIYMRFPQYWGNKVEFEPVWKKCLESVQQCCK